MEPLGTPYFLCCILFCVSIRDIETVPVGDIAHMNDTPPTLLDKKYSITDLEVGHRFITLWGHKLEDLQVIGRALYERLPDYLQEINHPSLSFHCPDLFHPFGSPLYAGRKPIRHIHILFPNDISDEDVNLIVYILDHQLLHRTSKNYTTSTMDDYVEPKLLDDDHARDEVYNTSYYMAKRAVEELWALKDMDEAEREGE